jgi:MFS family permease
MPFGLGAWGLRKHHHPSSEGICPATTRSTPDIRRWIEAQTIAWCIIFYFASAGASAAYLTVSEIFPLEVRAMAIAVFFAIAQGFGALGPVLYGALIGDGSNPTLLVYGYLLAAGIMIIGGLVETFLGIDAENKPLEEIAEPLSYAGR